MHSRQTMAAMNERSFYAGKDPRGQHESPVGGKREVSATMVSAAALAASLCFVNPEPERPDVATGPKTKKKKLFHQPDASTSFLDPQEMVSAAKTDGRKGSLIRLTSPTDVRITKPSMIVGMEWGSQGKILAQIPLVMCSRIKKLPPTLRGVADAARVLRASSLSPNEAGKENHAGGNIEIIQSDAATPPLLLSFPTESVYMIACCVKAASPSSIRKLLSRVDSQTSLSSGNSDSYQDPVVHQVNPSINDSIHPPNASLERMLKSSSSMAPTLFVLDGHHALKFCHFTEPKTFAIRPPSASASSKHSSVNNTTTHQSPSFAPLPTFGANASEQVPRSSLATTQNDLLTQAILSPSKSSNATTPITPNSHKLQAANFSESREAFLRLASKFWPGPVVIHVQARMLGEEEMPVVSHLSQKPASSSSITSIPSLPSMGDLVSAGSSNTGSRASISVPVLPMTALIPGREKETYFIRMQCPSHPLPRKILNEVYRGTSLSNSPPISVSQHPSSDSLGSVSSADDNLSGESKSTQYKASSPKNGRVHSNIAVVGCMVHTLKSSANNRANDGATTAKDVDKIMTDFVRSAPSINQHEGSQDGIYIVDGEDNRESFSVPTCQYGKPHPDSLVIDGDNRTIHLMRRGPIAKGSARGTTKEALLTKKIVYRALLEPVSLANRQTFIKKKKGDDTSIDRVITAVLSRWKIQESVTK